MRIGPYNFILYIYIHIHICAYIYIHMEIDVPHRFFSKKPCDRARKPLEAP